MGKYKCLNRMGKYLYKGSYIIEFFASILLSIFTFYIIYDKTYFSTIKGQNIMACFLLTVMILVIIICKLKREYRAYEKIFLTFMIPIGVLYLVLVCPGNIPDETTHIKRIAAISQGDVIMDVIEQKQYIPKRIVTLRLQEVKYDKLIKKIKASTNYEIIDEEGEYNACCTYFPFVYLVSGLVFKIGIYFNLSLVIMIYLARIGNFLVALLLGYYAIKVIPIGKLLLLTYLFNPIYIQQAGSVSADSLLNAAVILFVAYTMYLLFKKENMSWKDKIIYGILFLIAFLNKIAYYPISMLSLLLLIGKHKRQEKSERMYIASCLVLCTILSFLWMAFASQYHDVRPYIIEHNVNANEQISYVLQYPFEYSKTIINTMRRYQKAYFYQFFGRHLGSLNVTCPKIGPLVLCLLLLLAPFLEENQNKVLTVKQKIFMLLLVLIQNIIMITGMYLLWSGVGTNLILGIQGRYFIPFIIIALLCLIKKRDKKEFQYCTLTYLSLLVAINLVALSCVIHAYAN